MTGLALLAVLPALVLLIVIYRADNIEKEPISKMAQVFGLGCLTVISALILETLGSYALNILFWGQTDNFLYTFLMMFGVVAMSEEAGKFVVLKLSTWNSPEFNFSFDGIVYSVCATLGFATVENIKYVWNYGLDTALVRMVMSVPGHCIFGIFMGIYYGLAKGCEMRGDMTGKKINLYKAFFIPVFLHGLYDFSCSYNAPGMIIVLIGLEIFMTVKAIMMVNKMSKNDMPLTPNMQQMYYQQAQQMNYQQPMQQAQQMNYQQPMQQAQQMNYQQPIQQVQQNFDQGPVNNKPVFTPENIEG